MKTELQQASSHDFDFTFAVKKRAMGPHISKKWGWDENLQIFLHRKRWNEKPWFIIIGDNKAIGTVSIHEMEDYIRFGEFYLLVKYQRNGIGSKLLQKFLKSCDEKNLDVKLEYLKWNPVGSPYIRNGFKVTSEDETHYFLTQKSMSIVTPK